MPDQDEQAAALSAHIARVVDATRAFNRSVPATFKGRYPERLRRLDEPIRDEWGEQFLDWVDPALRAGYGLYLWA